MQKSHYDISKLPSSAYPCHLLVVIEFLQVKLGQISEVRMGYPFRCRLEHEPEGEVAVIQMKDIDGDEIQHLGDVTRVSLPDGKAHHLIQEGDLIFRSRGRSNSVALVGPNIGKAVLAAPMLLIRSGDVLPAYLMWFINLPLTQATLAALSEGTSVRMISKEAIQDLDIVVPSIQRQRLIVEIAALEQREEALMADLAAQRKRLINGVLMRFAKNSQ
ncbi:MAG: restriction endonuclease subunit S [Rhodocyclaceae bacterium]